MDPLTDPASLADRRTVDVEHQTETLPDAEFESLRDRIEDHAAVGLTNEEGAILLMNDGSHGWTLPAVPVDQGEDYAAVAREGISDMTGIEVELEAVERLREVVFRPTDGDQERRMYNVIFRASPVGGRPVAEAYSAGDADAPAVEWVESIPEAQSPVLAGDIQLFLE
jgi:ADP-ribose pyrophosphatase YjhB (NUDIX family)